MGRRSSTRMGSGRSALIPRYCRALFHAPQPANAEALLRSLRVLFSISARPLDWGPSAEPRLRAQASEPP